nr:hypothetical protein [uncultured Cohaesibacter sp.]
MMAFLASAPPRASVLAVADFATGEARDVLPCISFSLAGNSAIASKRQKSIQRPHDIEAVCGLGDWKIFEKIEILRECAAVLDPQLE